MKLFYFFLSTLLFYSGSTFAQDTAMEHTMSVKHTMLNKSDIKWVDGPEGLPAGAKVAVLEGNPGEEGPFTLRASLPANYKVPPHWHPSTENVVVLEGTLYMKNLRPH
ncbi:MAG: cupin domain-containing protein [Chitinophagaceae bacterium]|nr:cupin domain-containing protein [Chitinophagaceae bacterium]